MAHLEHVTTVAADLRDQLARSDAHHEVWQVDGHPTAGKSTLLHEVAKLLERDFVPVVVSPPRGELDAGPAALLQIANALKCHGIVNGETERLTDPSRPLAEKITLVRQWLVDAQEKVVLLCDEPTRWPAHGTDDLHFAKRTWAVVNTLLVERLCRRVVTGEVPEGVSVKGVRDLNLTTSDPLEWLRNPTNWGSLADAARDIARLSHDALAKHSPLQIRFLVALRALDAAPWTASPRDLTRRGLSRCVAEALDADEQLRALRVFWTKLALLRVPFGEDMLTHLGEQQLAEPSRDLLRHCLLYRRGTDFVLHETLRRDALERRWADEKELRRVHAEIARRYTDKFLANTTLFLAQLEAFHHATESMDDDLLKRLSPVFVEQLDALGRARSLAARRERNEERRRTLFHAAVESFRSSVQWEHSNAYAHHYWAFNLDVQAEGTTEVEEHYPKAIELEPHTPWWHSRWICYLITRGQARAAERAWDEALDALALAPPGGNAPAYAYEGLHVWVARLLLHRGQLDFAERVLESIPADVRESHVGLRALKRRLGVLLESRKRHAFLPGPLLHPNWWKERPALLQLQDRGKLVRWIAARVDEVDLQDRVLRLDGAEVVVDRNEEPAIRALEVTFKEFDRWNPDEAARSLSAGRFLEVGVYAVGRKGAQTRARVHPQRAWIDDDLPPLFPDPTRWLRTLTHRPS